jgi:hypothetical protein
MSVSLQTTLAAEVHLAEEQFLLKEQTLNIENSPTYKAGTRNMYSFQKRKNSEPK